MFGIIKIFVLAIFFEALCFSPLIFNIQPYWEKDENVLLKALENIGFKIILGSCISLVIPLVLEIIRDSILTRYNPVTYNSIIASLLLVFSLIVPDVLFLAYVLPKSDIKLFLCVNQGRSVALLSAMYAYLIICGGSYFKTWINFLTYFSGSLSSLLFLWSGFDEDPLQKLFWSATALLFFACCCFIIVITDWFRKQYHMLKVDCRPLSTNQYCCNVFLITSSVCFSGLLFTWVAYGLPNFENFSSGYLISTNIFFALFYVLIAVFQGSIARRDEIIEVRGKIVNIEFANE